MRKPNLFLHCFLHYTLPFIISSFLVLFTTASFAQVKIGDDPNTINSNSALEIQSTNKGFLPPRVAINNLTAITPLSGTVPAGMLVYSSGGSIPDGYYFWNGSRWAAIDGSTTVEKTASTTLLKSETVVMASGNIILTLPVITAADNGLNITVKNIGTHTDLVVVKGAGSTTIDGIDSSNLTRWVGHTFIAYNGNWVTKEKETALKSILEVSPTGSWTTIEEALDFLAAHITGPSVIKLGSGEFEINGSIEIDLNYPITIQGASYGKTIISPATGHSGPLFKAITETYFKMLVFEAPFNATSTTNFGNTAGNDAIQFEGAGEYFEVKDCSFDGFNKALAAETNIELWVFEVDISNAKSSGIEIAAGTTKYATLKVSEVDFISCTTGINLLSGDSATVSLINSTFYNATGGLGVNYVPASFTNFSSMFITNNAWNNVGTFFSGFDFTRTDGRDARAFIQNNAGDPNRNPSCYINVLNNTTVTNLASANFWHKATWNSSSATVNTTKWTVANSSGNVNRITYQPTNKRSGYFIISGNILCNNASRTVSIAVYKNATDKLGEITVRTGATANTATPFSTIIYVPEFNINDYFELFLSSANASDNITIQDMQWLTETK